MFRFGLAAALTVSGAAFVHDHHVLDRAGLFGSCKVLAVAAPNDGQWLACRPGSVTGPPDLSRDACSRAAVRGEVRFWLCPSQLVAGRTPGETSTR